MRVDERFLRYALALAFALGGLWAFLVRGEAWPFAMEDLQLGPHSALIAEKQLETALEEEVVNQALIMQLGRSIIAEEPLSIYPFEGVLTGEIERERFAPDSMDSEMADNFAAATLDRDGRNLTARLYLLDKAIMAGDWGATLDHFSSAYDLWPEQQEVLLEGLFPLLPAPGFFEALLQRSASGENWLMALLNAMPVDALEPHQITALHLPHEDLYERLLTRFVRQGEYQQAFVAWATLRPEEASTYQHGLVDLEFAGSDALRPFNWVVDRDYSEIMMDRQALFVSYRGRGRPVFLYQYARLPAGTYDLMIELEDIPENVGGDFVWQIDCLQSEYQPLSLSVFDEVFSVSDTPISFIVPEDCEHQEILLRGFPGQFTRTVQLQVNKIEIVRSEDESR
ncbi:MAG: hypothetical protein AAF269_14220 [Pseudomonadota bacterium]